MPTLVIRKKKGAHLKVGEESGVRMQLGTEPTVGCKAELDDGEDELHGAQVKDPVRDHFDGVEIYSTPGRSLMQC